MRRASQTQPILASSGFLVQRLPRPVKAYHLPFRDPISWTYARDVQNAIIKAYQEHHHKIPRRPLPPTFLTLRLKPVFTYGRSDERPSPQERTMLEGLPGWDGYNTETRMAWSREHGWRFHGPAQVHCWMVVDLSDWNWEVADVVRLMKSSLASMLEHYLPRSSYQAVNHSEDTIKSQVNALQSKSLQSIADMFMDRLVNIEVHENKYRIASYGCSINVAKDHVNSARRLSRYGLTTLEFTSLESEGWKAPENIPLIHDRFVAEITRRIHLHPDCIPLLALAKKLKAPIPKMDFAKDRLKPVSPGSVSREYVLQRVRMSAMRDTLEKGGLLRLPEGPLQLDAPTFRRRGQKGDRGVFVPSWGQFVKRAWRTRQSGHMSALETLSSYSSGTSSPVYQSLGNLEVPGKMQEEQTVTFMGSNVSEHPSFGATQFPSKERSISTETSSTSTLASEESLHESGIQKPHPKVLEQTIQWSSAHYLFVPEFVPQRRKFAISPRDVQDSECLDRPLSEQGDAILSAVSENGKLKKVNSRERLRAELSSKGLDRI